MEIAQGDLETRVKREKISLAVALALKGKWEEAGAVNEELLSFFPNDVESLNRLGKAHLEMARYPQAREAFGRTLLVSPHNTIAKKNLERLAHLREGGPAPTYSRKATPDLFIEESGKSGITMLHHTAPSSELAKSAAGDPVTLNHQGSRLIVENLQGTYLGEMEPKLATRLLRLMKGGNRYAGAIVSIHNQDVAVTLRETYIHHSLDGICSFPSKSSDEYMAYLRNSRLRLAFETEEEVEEWRDSEDATRDGESSKADRTLPESDEVDDDKTD